MVPVPLAYRHSSRLLYTAFSLASHYALNLLRDFWPKHDDSTAQHATNLVRRGLDEHSEKILFGLLIPIFVLFSGLFAGLTLGYMSLDETQLNVLAISGSPAQRQQAARIQPLRENGHLLLVTLLLANMIVNESLPIVCEPVLGSGVVSVVASTALIVIFSEIIPQSLFSRHGLLLGAKMAGFTQILIYALGIIAWPVAKLLEFVLGPHHGIIYRRAELKELIAMHSSMATHGGDLQNDTVTILAATLDLQEKVVKQAMTPIKEVFMLSIDSELDYDLLKKICMTGHSRVPVYEEIEIPIHGQGGMEGRGRARTQIVKKIVGILLVKQCVLLDPQRSVPLRNIPLNKVLFVPQNESLLGILDKFQEGRSHMAIVSRFSREKAASVKKVAKHSLTQRLKRVMGDSSDSSDEEKDAETEKKILRRRKINDIEEGSEDGETTLKGERTDESPSRSISRTTDPGTIGLTAVDSHAEGEVAPSGTQSRPKGRKTSQLSRAAAGMASISNLEQTMPADAVLAKAGAEEFLQGVNHQLEPIGIITLEDVLEELIGEEIYDEFDPQGAHGDPYVPPAQIQGGSTVTQAPNPSAILKPISLKGFNFLRSSSAPPSPAPPDTVPNTSNDLTPAPPFSRTHSYSNVQRLGTPGVVESGEEVIVRGPPSVIVEHHSSDSTLGGASSDMPSATAIPNPESASGKITKVSINQPIVLSPIAKAASAVHSVPPGSRSASPAPSLEAFLLDRKRRIGVSGSGVPGSLVVPAGNSPSGTSLAIPPAAAVGLRATSSLKGTRFKSTPLGGIDKPTGVLRVDPDTKHSEDTAAGGGTNDESRIPDGKDKEGPDKGDEPSRTTSRFML